ncbi:PorT family protein [Fibrella sp. HMF5335]|uniref:PorT family protein n=1 Tax=Fibrella rubiginis TaxID=2817060 RepID=A0A939GEB4_9BACT|nr:porin family protein [Fibrella rubiginis]MBO0937399.1 PorT family protein [Fibrella rubiginis]
MKKVAATGWLAIVVIVCLLVGMSQTGLAQARRSAIYYPKGSAKAAKQTLRDYKAERDSRQQSQSDYSDDRLPDYSRPSHLIEMSFRVAPGIGFNSADGTGAYSQFQTNGIGVRMSVGPSLDYFFFKDRYAFSSGLWYTIKRSSFVVPGSFGQDRFKPGAPAGESVYNLQYVQIPLTVKMYANNIGPDLRGYIQCGGLLDIKLAEKALDPTTNALYKFANAGGSYQRQYGFMDFGVLLGAGVQYKINSVNAVNVGLSYQRGLVNVMRANELESRNNTVALELGFKF